MAFFSDQLGMNKTVNRGVMLQPEDEMLHDDKLAAFDMHSTSGGLSFLGSGLKGGVVPKSLDWGSSDQYAPPPLKAREDKLAKKSLGGPSLVASVALDTTSKGAQSMQLSPVPVWLDTVTTILSKLTVAKTLEAVEEAIQTLADAKKIEFALNSAKMEITTTVISPARASCVVNLYDAKAPQRTFDGKEASSPLPIPLAAEIVMEFRRLSGCARAFHAFFHDILNSMDSSNFSRFESHAYSGFQFAELPNCMHTSNNSTFDDSLAVTMEMGSFSDTVNTLINMVQCEFDDAQKEALKALVAISTDNANKTKLGQKIQENSGFLNRLLCSSDKEVVGLTEIILRNLEFST